MATTNIRAIKKRLDHVLAYTENEKKVLNKEYGYCDYTYSDLHNVLEYAEADYKTEKRLYVTGINCSSENAYECMKITKNNFNKNDGVLGYHIIQSFNEGEVTPELAHKIGIELSEELFGDRFEVIVATHLNTKHYHNHIVLNSVSFIDGKKYYDNHETYSLIRKTSDNICKQYGLNVLEEKKCKGSNINYDNFYKKYASNNNYQNTAKRDLDIAISQAFSYEDFKNILEKMDYAFIVRSGKISIRGKDYKRNIRIERAFGDDYSIENIKKRILEKGSKNNFLEEAYTIKIPKSSYKKKYKKSKKKSTGFIALYYHYCFILKVFPSTKNVRKILPSSVRADVKQMDKYSNEARFLNFNSINTKIDLDKFKEDKQIELKESLSQRENLWKKRAKEKDGNIQKKMCEEISELSKIISNARYDLKLCEDIESRIPEIKEKLQEINEKSKGKEKNKDEYIK